ncbi:MAG: energy-coupled thiamine transporter ThiT [Lachnospiraceae bacterium]|nr:energy-coupled thiamine transporter ThiT [Lachnospiraceae bacterium]MBO6298325.1 energy-coupled thiamine transporter ThiT [Lachnospiraceae bacterium]
MQNEKTKILVEGALMIALATVLSFIRVVKLPWGGSITLLSMLPIVLFSIRRGVKAGLGVSFLFALVQFVQGIMDGLFGWGLTPGSLIACILLDYLLAFTVLGLAGLFRKKGVTGWICGIALAVLLRFVMHFLSGVVIWKSFGQLWGDFFTENTVLYSLLYNGAYMLPEMIFTIIGAVALLKMPKVGSYIAKTSD